MAGDAVLSVEGLRRSYGRVRALSGLTFSVPRGAFFGLFGRNGAGKTTTLDIVTGLRTRDAGRVTILGEELGLEPSPEVKGRIGYVAGHLELYGWMTCAEHIELMRKFYATWDADREQQLLALFHIPLRQKVTTLSAGQGVQLQLLMALAHHPELLLIDEPGNLDAVVRQRLMTTMIEAIADQETTVVMASHILSELDGVCDHMCIIHNGRALAVGPVRRPTCCPRTSSVCSGTTGRRRWSSMGTRPSWPITCRRSFRRNHATSSASGCRTCSWR
jgi:ABC-2 type transport system ATP-binding protein